MSYPQMGTYVSPFLPSYSSTSARSGGRNYDGQGFSGVPLQGKTPSSVLLYRGGNTVLSSPAISKSIHSMKGPDLCCGPSNNVPQATNKTVSPCGKNTRDKYTVRARSSLPPAPRSLDETFLANSSILTAAQTFREESTSYQTPIMAGCREDGKGRCCQERGRKRRRRLNRIKRREASKKSMPAVQVVNGVDVPVGADFSCPMSLSNRIPSNDGNVDFFDRSLGDAPSPYGTDYGDGYPGGTMGSA